MFLEEWPRFVKYSVSVLSFIAAGGLDSSVCLGASAAAPRQESPD